MVHLIACKSTIVAEEVAQLFYDHIVRLHGFPEFLVSDRDSKFTSEFWAELWRLCGTRMKMSTSYHPQTDGQTESVNRVVQDVLRAYVSNDRTDWDRHLTAVEIAINTSRHSSTGFTPYFLNANQEMSLPFGVAMRKEIDGSALPEAASAASEMAVSDEIARTRLADAQKKQAKEADEHRRTQDYKVLDQVMLSTKNLTKFKYKFGCRYLGPFVITAVAKGRVTLDLPEDMKRLYPTINVERLKKYTPSVGEWKGRTQVSRPVAAYVDEDGHPEYEVEAILGKQVKKEFLRDAVGKCIRLGGMKPVTRYLVSWLGYESTTQEWIRLEKLDRAAELIADWERKQLVEETGTPSLMFCCVRGVGQ
jgi:hypothetical protein